MTRWGMTSGPAGDASGGPTNSPAGRAFSFGEAAEAYDRFRPAPPASALEWILPSPCGTALDLGAGTGAVSRSLVEQIRHVVAVEPDERMTAVLAARSSRVGVVRAVAERIPLASGTVDAVVVSSAWHWMDTDQTVSEVTRVLRPGGVLGVLWNGPDRTVDWVAELLGEGSGVGQQRVDRARRHRVELPLDAPFGDPDAYVISWLLPMSDEELVGLAGTYSSVIVLPVDRRADELDRLRKIVASDRTVGGGDDVELPMCCRCWRAVRT